VPIKRLPQRLRLHDMGVERVSGLDTRGRARPRPLFSATVVRSAATVPPLSTWIS
jgi:hypothetical protein